MIEDNTIVITVPTQLLLLMAALGIATIVKFILSWVRSR